MLIFITAILLALLISFLCSLLESILLSISTTDIAEMSNKKPGLAKTWTTYKESIQKPISAILIFNTFAHTVGATVSGSKFSQLFGDHYLWIFSLAFTLAMIQWTEILPKTLGVRYRRRLSGLAAFIIRILTFILAPLTWLTKVLNRPFEGKKGTKQQIDAVKEINILTRFAGLNKIINEDQETIIERSIQLSRTKISEIMIERDEIKTLSSSMDLMAALIEAHIHHHTRFPLIDGTIDRVIGYVNFKDIVSALQINPQNPSLQGIVRPIMFVRKDESLTSLLAKLTKTYQHIAIVQDEKNNTIGLVTIEDVIEFMMGEIQDEYESLPTLRYQIAERRVLVGGGVSLATIRKEFQLEVDDSNQSIAEWMTLQLNRSLHVEKSFINNNVKFIIRKIRNGKIWEAIIEKQDPSQPQPVQV